MTKPFGFFQDSTGNRSYGRMASFVLVLGAILLALLGKDYGAMLASAVTLYGASKANQSVNEVWGKDAQPK